MRPPRFGVALSIAALPSVAPARPASPPAATAPAPRAPALFSSSRRLSSFSDIGPPSSDTAPPSLEDLSDTRGVALNVVVERRLAELESGERRHARRIECDTKTWIVGNRDASVVDLDCIYKDVMQLQWIVRVVGEREARRGGGAEMGVGGGRHAELGPAADRAPFARGGRERGDLQRPRETARFGWIDHEDVARIRFDQLEGGMQRGTRLVGCDRHRDGAPDLREAGEVEVRDGLLDELQVERLERPDPLDRRRNAPVDQGARAVRPAVRRA